MVASMWIAHGTKSQTQKLGARQYENVKDTKPTDYGGVSAGKWMEIFGKALSTAEGKKEDKVDDKNKKDE